MTKRPDSEWIRVEAPHLRIVSDEAWAAAHRRLEAAQAAYSRPTFCRPGGRPRSGIESPYLLSGMGECVWCRASMIVRSGKHGREGRRSCFVCASYDQRGRSVCSNGLRLPVEAADAAVLEALRAYVLDPAIVDGAIAEAVRQLTPSEGDLEKRRAALQAELRRLGDQQARYAAAIVSAGQIELVKAMKKAEQERQRVRGELAALQHLEGLSSLELRRMENELRRRVGDWKGLLVRHTPIARQMLGQLLDGRIAWTPRKEEGLYEFAGKASFDALLGGVVTLRMVPVRGFEPRSRG